MVGIGKNTKLSSIPLTYFVEQFSPYKVSRVMLEHPKAKSWDSDRVKCWMSTLTFQRKVSPTRKSKVEFVNYVWCSNETNQSKTYFGLQSKRSLVYLVSKYLLIYASNPRSCRIRRSHKWGWRHKAESVWILPRKNIVYLNTFRSNFFSVASGLLWYLFRKHVWSLDLTGADGL